MAEFLPSALADGQLPLSKGTLFTVPSGKVAIINSIVMVNTSGSTLAVNLYVNRTGTSRRIFPKDLQMNPNGMIQETFALTLEAGDILEGNAGTATTVDYVVSGVLTA